MSDSHLTTTLILAVIGGLIGSPIGIYLATRYERWLDKRYGYWRPTKSIIRWLFPMFWKSDK